MGIRDYLLLEAGSGKSSWTGLVYIKHERTWTNGDESFKYSCVQVSILNKNIEAGKCRMYSEHGEQFILLEYENN